VTGMTNTDTRTLLRKDFLRPFIRWLVIGVVLLWSLAALILVAARWIDPPTTAVHFQRVRQRNAPSASEAKVMKWGNERETHA